VFTGIIHHTVAVGAVRPTAGGLRLDLPAPAGGAGHVLGESIAVNGVCLTVAEISGPTLAFDVIRETLDKTNLGVLKAGDIVHVERSLRAGDPVDGHFVQGHVDGVGVLVGQVTTEREWRLRIAAPEAFAKYLVPKGSVAVDGVSLTLASVAGREFEVALIPTTLALTTLAKRQPGYGFNLECDAMAKTVVSYLERMGYAKGA
jgi:riboflavin synthase